MGGVTLDDLSPEVQGIVGKEAAEGACVSEQPVCGTDSRVTAQLTDDPPPDDQVLPWRIANAHPGDLLITPGGPSGMVGGLLSKLTPAQRYSHMGIVIDDGLHVRHATSASSRMDLFFDGSILGIQNAPTDGIKEPALRHQWPGTLTQSVEQAYLSWRDHPFQRDADGNAEEDANGAAIPAPGFGHLDAETGSSFLIDALGFGPVPDPDEPEAVLWPLVVTSCPDLTTTAVVRGRSRVADAARDIRGHYRLFAYTRGDIALDPAFDGPATYEATVRDANCNGADGLVPVEASRALVCSTFAWAAVQLANERGAAAPPSPPWLIVDGRPDLEHLADDVVSACAKRAGRQRDHRAGIVHPGNPDGLYHYPSSPDRKDAAYWLHDDYMVPYIRDKIDRALPNLWRDLGVPEGIGVLALLNMLGSMPATTVAVVLGVGAEVIKELVVLTSDMPDDVANQLTNAFASDDCTQAAKDSTDWQVPGDGLTVSPDDIVNHWAPPTAENVEYVHGLYGWNDRIRMRPPQWRENPPPPSAWQISQGFGSVEGSVFYRDETGADHGVAGAHIRIGCSRFASGERGILAHGDLPSGSYWCVASWTDPATGTVFESAGEPVEIPDGGSVGLSIELIGPPPTRREITVVGKMDLVNRYAIGEDWWDHPRFAEGPRYLGLDYWPAEPRFDAQRDAAAHAETSTSRRVDDWGDAQLKVAAQVLPDGSVDVVWQARLTDDPDDDPWQESGQLNVPARAGPAETPPRVVVDLVRSEMAWPVRAHIEFDVINDQAP